MSSTRNIVATLRSGLIGAGVGYLGASLLAAVSLINPALIPSIALANAIGNAGLTLIAGNTVETLGTIGEVTTGTIAGIPTNTLDKMQRTKSIFSSAIIPTASLTAREVTGSALGVALLLFASQFSSSSANLTPPLWPTVGATAIGTTTAGLTLHLTVRLIVALGLNFGLPALHNAAAVLGMEAFTQINEGGGYKP